MVDTVLNTLTFETLALALFGLVPLLILASRRPEVVLALGLPALLFSGQLKAFIPISTSAVCAVFPLVAIAGGMLKGYRFRFGRIEKAFILLTVLMYVSLWYSHSPVYGTEKVVLVVGLSLPLVLAASYTLVTFEAMKRVLNIISATLAIYIAASAVAKLSGAEAVVGDRFAAIQGPTMAARYLGLGAVVCLCWWCPRETVWKAGGFALGAGAIPLVFLTGTRTAIAALAGVVPAVQWVREKEFFRSLFRRGGRTYLLLIVVFVASLFGPLLLSHALPQGLAEGRFSSWGSFFNPGELRYPTSHVLNTVVAWDAFCDSPVAGFGAGGYKGAMEDHVGRLVHGGDPRHPTYPHNVFLEFLTEQGLPGLLLFCYMMYHALRILLDVRRRLPRLTEPSERMAVITVSAFFIYGFLVAQTAVDIPRQHILWWGLGLLVGLRRIWGERARTVRASAGAKYLGKAAAEPGEYSRCPPLQQA